MSVGAHPRPRLIVYGRRMLGAMLCWTALQAAAAQVIEPVPAEASQRR